LHINLSIILLKNSFYYVFESKHSGILCSVMQLFNITFRYNVTKQVVQFQQIWPFFNGSVLSQEKAGVQERFLQCFTVKRQRCSTYPELYSLHWRTNSTQPKGTKEEGYLSNIETNHVQIILSKQRNKLTLKQQKIRNEGRKYISLCTIKIKICYR
jgi:hypothetical protein